VGESRGLFPKSYCSMSAAEPTARMAVAVFDYTPDKEDQDQFLLLKEGEILTIISCEEGPWWYGNLNGKQVPLPFSSQGTLQGYNFFTLFRAIFQAILLSCMMIRKRQ